MKVLILVYSIKYQEIQNTEQKSPSPPETANTLSLRDQISYVVLNCEGEEVKTNEMLKIIHQECV